MYSNYKGVVFHLRTVQPIQPSVQPTLTRHEDEMLQLDGPGLFYEVSMDIFSPIYTKHKCSSLSCPVKVVIIFLGNTITNHSL